MKIECTHCKKPTEAKWYYSRKLCEGCSKNQRIKVWWTSKGRPHPLLLPELIHCIHCRSFKHISNMAFIGDLGVWQDPKKDNKWGKCQECEWYQRVRYLAKQALKREKIKYRDNPDLFELQVKIYETRIALSKEASQYGYLTTKQIDIYDYTSKQLKRNAPGIKRESSWLADRKKEANDRKRSKQYAWQDIERCENGNDAECSIREQGGCTVV